MPEGSRKRVRSNWGRGAYERKKRGKAGDVNVGGETAGRVGGMILVGGGVLKTPGVPGGKEIL